MTFVALDLTTGNAATALEDAGHDAARSSLFIGEGLLLYLDVPVIEHLFGALRNRATRAATLALTLARDEWETLLRTTGWTIARAVEPHSIEPEVPAGGALLVTANPVLL